MTQKEILERELAKRLMDQEERRKLQTGRIPVIVVNADNLCQAWHHLMLECWLANMLVETPKYQKGGLYGFDAQMLAVVDEPLSFPNLHKKGITDTPEGLESYRLEVVFGLYDCWVGHGWDYTYHQRLIEQIDRMIERIKKDWQEKGRVTGRDYQITTWRPEIDQIIDDPPCLQRLHFRLLPDLAFRDGSWRLNLSTDWRSRDLAKAWLMNAWAIVDWQRLIALRLSKELGILIKTGQYVDYCNSLHIYGSYLEPKEEDDCGLEKTLQIMQNGKWQDFALNSDDYLKNYSPELAHDSPQAIRRFLAAQRDYYLQTEKENPSCGIKRAKRKTLLGAGYNLDNYPYPSEWDL